MTRENTSDSPPSPPPPSNRNDRVEEFLSAIEKKTPDPVHHRLLRACRQGDPAVALESELGKIISEIVDET